MADEINNVEVGETLGELKAKVENLLEVTDKLGNEIEILKSRVDSMDSYFSNEIEGKFNELSQRLDTLSGNINDLMMEVENVAEEVDEIEEEMNEETSPPFEDTGETVIEDKQEPKKRKKGVSFLW